MSKFFSINVELDEKGIQGKIDNLIDDSVMVEIHTAFARIINDFVPYDTGNLAENDLEITKDYVRYAAEYAHYMYYGEIYGPNIPVYDSDGNVEGFFSLPNVKKKPTGRKMTFNTEKHPSATSHWDKVAMQTRLKLFEQEVKNILLRRAKSLYG